MSLLNFSGKTFLIFGVANRKSIAWFVGKTLEESGANVLYSVRSDKRKIELSRWLNPENVFVCDVEQEAEIECLKQSLEARNSRLDGVLHS